MMRILLTLAVVLMVGCGSSDPAPATPAPPVKKSTKTKAEKADALLRHVTGKETTVITKLQESIDENQQRALDEIDAINSQ